MCAADFFQQDAYGYYTFWYPGHAMLTVDYCIGDGMFLFAQITDDSFQDAIFLSEPVDVYNRRAWSQTPANTQKTSPEPLMHE